MSTDYRALPAGRELDALVAERVMGFRWYVSSSSGCRGIFRPDDRPSWFTTLATDHDWQVPHYSTDIAAAWGVVDAIVSRGMRWGFSGPRDNGCWIAAIRVHAETDTVASAEGDTLALAIVRAALADLDAAQKKGAAKSVDAERERG